MTLVERLSGLAPDVRRQWLTQLPEDDFDLLGLEIRQHYALTRPEQWCHDYFPQAFPLEFGAHHRWLLHRLGPAPAGVRAYCAAPRGSGKTTVALFANPIRVIAIGSHRFVVIVAKTDAASDSRLDMIADELEANERLVRDYPNLRIVRRVKGELELAGGKIVSLGAGVSVRGLLRRLPDGSLPRPDLFLGDDLETDEQARSTLRTNRLEEWLMADVSNLGGPGPELTLDVVMIDTTIEADALATRAINNRGRFAGWQTARFPAEYRGDDGIRRAAWPQGQPLERLDKLITPGSEAFIGSYTYAKEYLLDPLDREDAVIRRAWMRHGRPPGIGTLRYVTLGIDPSATEKEQKEGDPSAIVMVGLDDENFVWVLRAWHGRVSQKRLFDKAQDWLEGIDLGQIAFEAVGGFAWGVQELRRRGMRHRGIKPTGDKLQRLQSVALLYEQGYVWHDAGLQGSELEAELLGFPEAAHDDLVDALVHAVRMATNDGRRRPEPIEAARTKAPRRIFEDARHPLLEADRE